MLHVGKTKQLPTWISRGFQSDPAAAKADTRNSLSSSTQSCRKTRAPFWSRRQELLERKGLNCGTWRVRLRKKVRGS